jgi:hypothetical protein
MKVVRVKTEGGMNKLHDIPSREEKREYQLKDFCLSELVRDLW